MSIQVRGVVGGGEGGLILIHVIAMLAGNTSGYAATFISPGGRLLAAGGGERALSSLILAPLILLTAS